MGVEIKVENLTKRFGRQTSWEKAALTLPAGESWTSATAGGW